MISSHVPVMANEVLSILKCFSGGTYLDCTLGDGGHSELILKESAPDGRLIALDQDADSIERASLRLSPMAGRFQTFNENFENLTSVIEASEIPGFGFNGILMDLGVSYYQLSQPERGFSFMHEGPLDMRMNRNAPKTAFDLINHLSEKELADIFFQFGEESYARKIARRICESRKKQFIESTTQLGDLVYRCKNKKRSSVRAETKVFQALRIAVNREMEVLQAGLSAAFDALLSGGRLCVISFHSLEDRIVKWAFREKAKEEKGAFTILTRKPMIPSQTEMLNNSRSRSAKLRALEKN